MAPAVAIVRAHLPTIHDSYRDSVRDMDAAALNHRPGPDTDSAAALVHHAAASEPAIVPAVCERGASVAASRRVVPNCSRPAGTRTEHRVAAGRWPVRTRQDVLRDGMHLFRHSLCQALKQRVAPRDMAAEFRFTAATATRVLAILDGTVAVSDAIGPRITADLAEPRQRPSGTRSGLLWLVHAWAPAGSISRSANCPRNWVSSATGGRKQPQGTTVRGDARTIPVPGPYAP